MNPTLTKLLDARREWEQLPVADRPHHHEPRHCLSCHWFQPHRDTAVYGRCQWNQKQTVAGHCCIAWRRNPNAFREFGKQPKYRKTYA